MSGMFLAIGRMAASGHWFYDWNTLKVRPNKLNDVKISVEYTRIHSLDRMMAAN